MLRTKLKDLISALPLNKDFYCYQVPEEYHYWTERYKWEPLNKYKVEPVRIRVHGVKEDSVNELLKYSAKNPLHACGVPIRGHESSNQNTTYVWDFRTSSVETINEVLTDLCKQNGVESVRVKELDILNLETNAILRCEVFNPDGTGSSLYIIAVQLVNDVKFYPSMGLADMRHHVGTFNGNLAKCCLTPTTTHGCVIENQINQSQIKRVKNRKKP